MIPSFTNPTFPLFGSLLRLLIPTLEGSRSPSLHEPEHLETHRDCLPHFPIWDLEEESSTAESPFCSCGTLCWASMLPTYLPRQSALRVTVTQCLLIETLHSLHLLS